jgi:hypothetical protein
MGTYFGFLFGGWVADGAYLADELFGADAVETVLPTNQSVLGHIFLDAEGHLPNTPENQALLQDVANDPAANLETDQYGSAWSARTLPNGSQVCTQSRNGQILNGGLNQTPQVFNPQTGLSSPIKPGG